ncbi:MAG: hypothetical protein COB09_18460 [Thalassobium sp.]|nr:MAG: hypothetical protein COB09_18460 [Thalassobium sp.]
MTEAAPRKKRVSIASTCKEMIIADKTTKAILVKLMKKFGPGTELDKSEERLADSIKYYTTQLFSFGQINEKTKYRHLQKMGRGKGEGKSKVEEEEAKPKVSRKKKAELKSDAVAAKAKAKAKVEAVEEKPKAKVKAKSKKAAPVKKAGRKKKKSAAK